MRSTGSRTPIGAASSAAGEAIAAGGIAFGTRVDRHRQRQDVDGAVERLVVATEAAAERGDVGVVDRAPGCLAGGVELVEGDLEGLQPATEAPPAQQR